MTNYITNVVTDWIERKPTFQAVFIYVSTWISSQYPKTDHSSLHSFMLNILLHYLVQPQITPLFR
jgi:hypothetical protein